MLLSDELEQLNELESKLKALDFKLQDSATIMQRVAPLFDEILLRRLQTKDAMTLEILSDHLARIISESSAHDSAALSQSLQSVISPAISKEIAENKETMIDALYPIMGGMISKYVTQAIREMMETINHKIEQGFSLERYKRKLKAKMSGVSETELLFEESGEATIYSLLIIHKESSLLIAEGYLEDQKIDEPHMVASMASAIKDFINDWVKKNNASSEVQVLSYGNATLYIESAGSVYLIAFLDAEPDNEQRLEINHFFASIVKKYGDFFTSFNGDDSAQEVKSLSYTITEYLNEQKELPAEKEASSANNVAKYIFYFLGLLLLGYGIYLVNIWNLDHSLEKRIHEQTGQQVNISHQDDSIVLNGYADSMEAVYAVEKVVSSAYPEQPVRNELLLPMRVLDNMISTQNGNKKVPNKNMSKTLKDLSQENMNLTTEIERLKEELRSVSTEVKRLKKQTKLNKVN